MEVNTSSHVRLELAFCFFYGFGLPEFQLFAECYAHLEHMLHLNSLRKGITQRLLGTPGFQ